MIYLELLLGFLKVGFFSFGGAYSAIPLIRDVVLAYGWLTDEELTYMIAVSESTPGPIMVNLATYIGSTKGGILGAALATFIVVLPSFLIILLFMVLLKSALKNKYVQGVLHGMEPCIMGIILATGIFMLVNTFYNPLEAVMVDVKAIIIAIILVLIILASRFLMKKKISPIAVICISAVLGIAVY